MRRGSLRRRSRSDPEPPAPSDDPRGPIKAGTLTRPCSRALRSRCNEERPIDSNPGGTEELPAEHHPRTSDDSVSEEEPRNTPDRQVFYDVLLETIQSLPPVLRQAAQLIYIEGRSPHEIAEVLGVPPATARKRMHRMPAANPVGNGRQAQKVRPIPVACCFANTPLTVVNTAAPYVEPHGHIPLTRLSTPSVLEIPKTPRCPDPSLC